MSRSHFLTQVKRVRAAVCWTEGHLPDWTEGHLPVWTEGYLPVWTEGYLPVWTVGHLPVWTEGHLPVWTESHRNDNNNVCNNMIKLYVDLYDYIVLCIDLYDQLRSSSMTTQRRYTSIIIISTYNTILWLSAKSLLQCDACVR